MTPKQLGAAAALIGIMAAYVWASTGDLLCLITKSDTWAHLAAIRRTMDSGLFPGDFFYAGEPTPPYYSLSHILFAFISRVTGLPPHEVFVAAPATLIVLDVAVVFLWLRQLTGDLVAAVAGSGVELLLFLPSPPWWTLAYPRDIAIVPFYLAWWSYLRGRAALETRWLLLAGFFFGLSLATHLFTGALCLVGILLQDFAMFDGTRRSLKSLSVVFALGSVLASPWIASFIFDWWHRTAQVHPIFKQVWERWAFNSNLPYGILRPSVVANVIPAALWILLVLGTFVSVRNVRRRSATVADRYAVLALIVGVLMTMTPLFTIPVIAFGVWAARVLLIVPFSLLVGRGVSAALAFAAESRKPTGWTWPARLGVAGLLFWTIFSAASALAARVDFASAVGAEYLRQHGPDIGGWDLQARLAQSGPLPRVVLSDPDTSYLLPYLIGSYVVTMPAAHGSPYADHLSRENAVRDFFRPNEPKEELYKILDEYGADDVALAPASPWPSKGQSAALIRRLRHTPGFIDSGCCGDVEFFTYTRPAAGRGA